MRQGDRTSEQQPYTRARRDARWLFLVLSLGFDLATGVISAQLAGLHAQWTALLLLCATVMLRGFGLYRERPSLVVADDLPRIWAGIILGAAIPIGLVMAMIRYQWQRDELNLGLIVIDADAIAIATAFWLVLVLVGRAFAYLIYTRLRARNLVANKTLIIGLYTPNRVLARALLERPQYGMKPVGFLAADQGSTPENLELPILGSISDITAVIEEHNIGHVIVGETTAPPLTVVSAVRECDRLDVEVYIIPALSDLVRGAVRENIWSIPILRLPRRAFRSGQWLVKRVADRVLAFAALILLSPIIGIAALLLTRETKAGIIFRQRRVGLDGREFDVLKLQTMKPATHREGDVTWNIANDDRLGPVGKFLRKTSIDELPQLWNVVRGDMCLVGPRPERPHFVSIFQAQFPLYLARHRVPCGITGYAQIHGLRGDTSIEDRIAFDNLYIESWSLWLDFKILIRTIPTVIFGAGG